MRASKVQTLAMEALFVSLLSYYFLCNALLTHTAPHVWICGTEHYAQQKMVDIFGILLQKSV